MNVLIVEDTKELAVELIDYLDKSGYVCKWVATCEEALEEVSVNQYDALLLDLGLPDGSGFDVLKSVRKAKSKMAVIVITARGELDDKINGLDLGADDYLTKPFALTELGARLYAVIRRIHGFTVNELDIHGFKIRLQDYKVSYQENAVALTKKNLIFFNIWY